jgi:hypothetical protein
MWNASCARFLRRGGLALILALMLGGCAGILDGRVVTKEGKESPYKVMTDKYEPPRDPTTQF